MTNTVLLTGTPRSEERPRVLRAGRLEATYAAGAMRCIRWNNVEILRAVLFLVRTPGWGTPSAKISSLEIEESAKAFTVAFEAHYAEPGKGVIASVRIAGLADGKFNARATIRAEREFETNRTGFVILHPLDGFAGTDVEIEHASGSDETLKMPLTLSPGQPVKDIHAITHRPAPGLTIETRFEGDIFEMEDQRQWSDASFKTYNRPLALVSPYLISPDEPIEQSVSLTVTGTGKRPAPAVTPPKIEGQQMPSYALPLDRPGDAQHALNYGDAVKALGPQILLLRYDLTEETSPVDAGPLARLLSLTRADLEVQIVTAAQDTEALDADIARVARELSDADVEVARVSAFAKIDENSYQPGQERPPHAAESDLAAALVRHFPSAQLIGGSPAFFTEFNRKRPDTALWQGVTFATTPVVHASDDASVMETLQSLPHIATSAKTLANGLPLSIGPIGIGMRFNPYGSAPAQNEPELREEMAARDPRQRGVMAAAWIVGYLAQIAPYSFERFAFAAPTGPFGLISSQQEYPRAFWDDQSDGALYPIFHVARWLSAAAGARIVAAGTESDVAFIVWERDGAPGALVANLTSETRDMPDLPLKATVGTVLDGDTAADLARTPDHSVTADWPTRLTAYAVAHTGEVR
ncbi:hypothetical protein OA238_c24220 [Octadecabacter arcticus 238]|jgi:hypothetical protein|uniref:Uncharacterized protein n=1 Tax=Octadecabacter arcticus 238 TaxID=391616 RepID=M9RRS1_9RHOB|nr:hypothetical protein [Octadecabacter arcticus]AGI72480.1 hypothetical protein OA238_c24220 [Octadecabacter arcticus 238]